MRREDGHRHAEVGQVADAPFGQVDVVVEEDVADIHRLDRVVAHPRAHQGRVGTTGELAQPPVVDAGPEVVGVADHRRARGASDGGLDLLLDRGQRAGDDLDEHRVGVDLPATLATLAGHRAFSLVSSRLPKGSTVAAKPGCTGTVEPNSSMIAGPVTTSPGPRAGRS